jgi:hypothetical protein
MTQYFFVDESGDPGLEGQASSSSHFVITMVQLPARVSLRPLVNLRKALQVKSTFEFKYHTTTTSQKDLFFKEILHIPFRVRAVSLNKARIDVQLRNLQPPELVTELIILLTFPASELDIANEVLMVRRQHFAGICACGSPSVANKRNVFAPLRILSGLTPEMKMACRWQK